MNATQNIKVGDQAIYRDHDGARPVETTVTKVTKAGWIETAISGPVKFKRVPYAAQYVETGKGSGEVAPYDKHTLAKWILAAERHEQRKIERQAERDREAAERQARLDAELAETQAACGTAIANAAAYGRSNLPDGSRLYTMHLPVKAEYAERKKGYEVVMVRCVDDTGYDCKNDCMVGIVRAYVTYVNGGSSSFPSCGGNTYTDDAMALLHAARSCYTSW